MRKLFFIVAVVAGLMVPGWSQNAGTVQMNRAHVNQFYTAVKNHDTNTLNNMLASGALIVDPNVEPSGTVAASQWVSDLASLNLSNFSISSFQLSTPSAETSIVSFKLNESGTYNGKALSGTSVVTQTWIRQNGHWKLAASQQTLGGY
jgi:ketosteroid isomerase-like protein